MSKEETPREDISKEIETKEDLGETLCKYCTLEKKGVYGVDGGYMAGCEGSRCDDAYENYLDTLFII